MLFNSLEFGIFLFVVFTVYLLLNKGAILVQNSFLVIASYFFYGWWDWRFLFLILLSTMVDYYIGLQIEKSTNQKNGGFLCGRK